MQVDDIFIVILKHMLKDMLNNYIENCRMVNIIYEDIVKWHHESLIKDFEFILFGLRVI